MTEVERVAALVELMVAKGVRRVRFEGCIDRKGVNVPGLEVELDPAAQLINRHDEPPPAPEKEPGLCRWGDCKARGGHMAQPYCREHFHLAMTTGGQP